jgi:hypothetical protein
MCKIMKELIKSHTSLILDTIIDIDIDFAKYGIDSERNEVSLISNFLFH